MRHFNYVQIHRRYKRITQEELAQKLGIPWKQMHLIETGRMLPALEMRERISKELGIDLKILFP